jgi:hypothetical protein
MRPHVRLAHAGLIALVFLVTREAAAQQPPPPPPAYAPPGAYAPPPGGPTTPVAAYPPPGYPAYAPPPAPPPPPEKHLGIGYKIGNGWGFLGGDVIISPVDHLSIDLQANTFSYAEPGGTATGYALAPGVQGRLYAGQISSPYLGIGYEYGKLSLNEVNVTLTGFFMNVGYEWRWESGLGILLGGGFNHISGARATNGIDTVDYAGGNLPNLEAGLRYMFL